MNNVAAIVMCAGKGVRMKSATSKMLHNVAGLPLCVWPVRTASNLIGSGTVAVVGYQAEQVKEALTRYCGANVEFATQVEQKGTGDAVRIGLEKVSHEAKTILVLSGDTPLLTEESLKALIKVKMDSNANLALVVTTLSEPFGYGRIMRDKDNQAMCVVEERDAILDQRAICEVNAGIYAFDAQFLREQIIKLQNSNAQKEFYLTDLIKYSYDQAGSKSIATLSLSAEEVSGINDRIQLSIAESHMRRRINNDWMSQGVTMIDPFSTYVDATVVIGSDVTLYPNVSLKGDTQIKRNVEIGTGCVVIHSSIDENSHILPYSIIESSKVGRNANVGPFARLRPETVLQENTRVGNFVEVKKTTIMRGAKANHLAYLGDAVIGENSNIGAGTITCNYDGFNKHKTVIAEGCFIGSNSTLVAPVEIGEGSYVAAGSTITKNVPSDALAVSRPRQENKIGYAPRIRNKLNKNSKKDTE